MTKVKRDSHSLYVRAGGYVFRPVFPTRQQFLIGNGTLETFFKEGQEVTARHIGGSQYGTVKTKNNKELWQSHGSYIKGHEKGYISSELIWKPKYMTW